MATWPASLPQSLLLPLTRTQQAGSIRSPMDIGPAKQRARYTAVASEWSGALLLTQAQLATFDTFFEDTLGFGTDQFTWVNPETGVSASLRFKAGSPPKVSMVRPDATTANRLYRVTVDLELLP